MHRSFLPCRHAVVLRSQRDPKDSKISKNCVLYWILSLRFRFELRLYKQYVCLYIASQICPHFCSLLFSNFCSGYCRTRAGYSRGDQFYASYPAGTELLTDTTKVLIFFDLGLTFSNVVRFLCSFSYYLL